MHPSLRQTDSEQITVVRLWLEQHTRPRGRVVPEPSRAVLQALWPIGDHYAEQSNVTQAHRLEGELLLIVGEVDRNVDPASTMQVVDALIEADKDFDLLVMPSVGHGAMGTPYGTRRMQDFFVRHLWGKEPRGE